MIFNHEQKKILEQGLVVFGVPYHLNKCSEELSELIKELLKVNCKNVELDESLRNPKNLALIQEEIVDVEILLHQIKEIYGFPDKILYQKKIDKLKGKIDGKIKRIKRDA